MSDNADANSLERIYIEASEWIRLSNSIIWTMGTFLVPISASCIGLAVQYVEHKRFLAAASVFLFGFWVYVSRLYRATAASARGVLMNIESEWGIDEKMALYKQHGQVGLKKFGLFNLQVLFLVILIILWVILLYTLPDQPIRRLSQPTARFDGFYQLYSYFG